MTLLVTSSSGSNGPGFGKILAFDAQGRLIGPFGHDPRIADPRGLAIDAAEGLLFVNSGSDRILALDRNGRVVRASETVVGLNPGGANFGPDGRYYIGLRSARTLMAFQKELDSAGSYVLPKGVVPFPRGFAFGADGTLFLASGVGPDGTGDDTIVAFDPEKNIRSHWRVKDPDLSPLDLAIAPNGNVVVSSEKPFGHPDAVTSIREYAASDGQLVRVLSPSRDVELRNPRGLRFARDGQLYCVGRDEVVAFDFDTGKCVGSAVKFPNLNGQALIFFPVP